MAPRIGRGDPAVESIIQEMTALNTALRATTDPNEVPEARRLVQQVFTKRAAPETFEDFVISTAMSKILDVAPPASLSLSYSTDPWPKHVFEQTGLAWAAWARGCPEEAAQILQDLREEPAHAEDGAVHLLALQDWMRAIDALLIGARGEAERFFKRAVEIGASFGTDSHPVVLWTMAASLFPKPTTT